MLSKFREWRNRKEGEEKETGLAIKLMILAAIFSVAYGLFAINTVDKL